VVIARLGEVTRALSLNTLIFCRPQTVSKKKISVASLSETTEGDILTKLLEHG
jgi:hypothetical protein